MAKKIFFWSIFILTSLTAISQSYFEGEITYKFTFKSEQLKDPNILLTPIFGNGSTLYFKEGNYRHEYESGTMEFDLYNKSDNKMYQKKRNNDTIYWVDCGNGANTIQDTLFYSKTDTILGIICDRLTLQYKEESEIHYYNSDSICINPDWFKNYKLNDEYLIDRKEKSIYLKSEHLFKYFTLIETATKISREKIDIEKFKIPKNSILLRAN